MAVGMNERDGWGYARNGRCLVRLHMKYTIEHGKYTSELRKYACELRNLTWELEKFGSK